MSMIERLTLLFSIFSPRIRQYRKSRRLKPSDNDDDLLLSKICMYGHHLDKALKKPDRSKEDIKINKELGVLTGIAKQRKLQQRDLIYWADDLTIKFEDLQNSNEMKIVPVKEKKEQKKKGIFTTIFGRKSTRFWIAMKLSLEDIFRIVEAGLQAPCSANRQAFKVIVKINDRDNITEGSSENSSMMEKAPVLFYIAADSRVYYEKYAAALDSGSFCATALIAAEALGVSGTWMYLGENINQKEYRKKFKLGTHYYFYSVLALGYPGESAQKPPRKDLDEIVILG